MKNGPKTISIDGEEYVKKGATPAKDRDGMPYVIVRTFSAGVFAGYLASRNGKEVVVQDARRIWYWTGAASLSQLAMEGTKSPDTCKFPVAVSEVTLTEAIEILPCTEEAKESIESVKIWAQ